jgi:glycine cleavage system pyridoxal-binding protein P
LLIVCLIIVLAALYAFYVGLKAISDITSKTQTTNLYLMKKLHMDQDRVDGEIDNIIKKEVNKNINKKVKILKKEINDKLKDFN